MEKLVVTGGKKLFGKITASGAKNAVLPVMAASLLADGVISINNVPNLTDIKLMAHLMRIIGAQIETGENHLKVNTEHCCFFEAPYELVSKMRASIYVLAPLLARFGRARVSLPGGCAIGARPINLHLEALKKMGADIKLEGGYINASVKRFSGAEIRFEKISVGATVTAIMAAVTAKGETTIFNSAVEPEVTALCEYLNKMNAKISGIGTDKLIIQGVDKLTAIDVVVIPDRIEAGTFLIAGAITQGDVTVLNCEPEHLKALTDVLVKTGSKVAIGEDWIRVVNEKRSLPCNIIAEPYPAFPTDLQAQLMALLALADGESIIEDTVFPERFHHVPELNRLDANIVHIENRAEIKGVEHFSGAEVMATDLRASAALVLAGLAAEGETIISRIYHLDRGYEKMEKKLIQLGADIKRIIA